MLVSIIVIRSYCAIVPRNDQTSILIIFCQIHIQYFMIDKIKSGFTSYFFAQVIRIVFKSVVVIKWVMKSFNIISFVYVT